MAAVAAMPGASGFQFFPLQVGPCTPYARSRKYLFMGVSVYQALMALMALLEFANFLSGIVMLGGCLIAFWAVKEDMNITYVSWFGVVSFIGFVAGVVGAFIGFAVKISTIIVKFNIPMSCFFGCLLAWFIFADYEEEHPESNDMVGSWCRAFRLLKPKPIAQAFGMPASGTLLSKGALPQFGSGNLAGYSDNAKGAAAGYGAYGMGQLASAKGYATEQANQYGAMGKDAYATQQANANQYGAAGQAYANQYGAAGQDAYAQQQAKAQEGGFASSFFGGGAGVGAAFGGAGVGAAFAGPPIGAPAKIQDMKGPGDVRRDPFLTQ